jgi:hypothetical protein
MANTERTIERDGWLIVHDPAATDRWIATDRPVEIVD